MLHLYFQLSKTTWCLIGFHGNNSQINDITGNRHLGFSNFQILFKFSLLYLRLMGKQHFAVEIHEIGWIHCVTIELQTRAASIIEGRKVEQCEIHDILDWPTLDSRRKYQVFKCVNGLAPAYLLNEFNFSQDFHKYKTRNKDLIRVTRAKTTKYQSSFRYNGAKAWNTLPHLVRTETSLSSFKHKLKKHLFM